jgi:alkylation response protein AidB-like acyl-CoA dehydrogenase
MGDRLTEEQRMMQRSCRDYVDEIILPFIRDNWRREWNMSPEARLPPAILQGAEEVGVRTLGIPEEYGGIELDPATEVQTFALISEEIARGDSGVADKLVQNWKVSVLLRELAPKHLQRHWFARLREDPQFLLAHCLTEPRGASDRWLPYNVPEAAMTTRAVKQGKSGSSTDASSSSPTVMTPACTSSTPTRIRRSACCRARPASWCRAIRRD